ncbi:helix-turn-helix domain-containing protein [Paenibacillus sp. NRS-1780]|uniref:helix-turn-helix domain-containing protein n=1 Tax=Paenibacillus sp. NRS-1780 TaxID=3233904 RepID=UPI003D273F17
MKHTPTVLAELEDYLKQNNLTLAEFAKFSGVHQRTLSNWITQHRSVSVEQLDRITLAMGLPEGYFYELYIENYIIDLPPNWRRIEPLLYHCAELDKLDAIRRMVGHIMDNLLYSPKLFEIAEALLAQGRHAAALLLYENVAEVEKYQHSERLAVCQYRIFTIQIGDDQSRNLKAATIFEAFVERLDEIDQLDALKDLANVYRSLLQWDKVYDAATKLREKAKIQYSLDHIEKRKHRELEKKTRGPLFGYIVYPDLLCSGVCEAQGDYQQALQYTYAYADLDWVLETDEDTLYWIGLFQHWAEGNTYVYKLLSGDISVLNDYVEYIAASTNKADKEMVTKLLNVMFAANRYQLNVNDILKRFETVIDSFVLQEHPSSDIYTKQVIPDQFARFGYELAYYYLYQGMHRVGFKHLIYAMESSNTLNNVTCFKNCLGLFAHFRAYAIPETQAEFYNFIEKVWLDNVEKNGTADRRG